MEARISAQQAFQLLVDHRRHQQVLVDVRSEGEFFKGSFPGAVNIPLLNNAHRHQVGLCYKKQGQAKAIELGHQLVAPLRSELVTQWLEALGSSPVQQPAMVYCWRGGLRSKLVCQWLASQWMEKAGGSPLRVEGGFKGLRREVFKVFRQLPGLKILGGMTGSGKTRLLAQLKTGLDLESLAQHRGSAFGLLPNETQPSQLDFENRLALELARAHHPPVVEDESPRIGRLFLPEGMYQHMAQSPFVLLQAPLGERVQNIYREYIEQALSRGIDPYLLHQHLCQCTERIRPKLGGLKTDQTLKAINSAFECKDPLAHQLWISSLLQSYYDPLYKFSMQRKGTKPQFTGDFSECLHYLSGGNSCNDENLNVMGGED